MSTCLTVGVFINEAVGQFQQRIDLFYDFTVKNAVLCQIVTFNLWRARVNKVEERVSEILQLTGD